MHSLEGIIAANRAAERNLADKDRAATLARNKAGQLAALKYHDKEIARDKIKQDKSGRLAR